MSIGIFLDKEHQPTMTQVLEVLETRWPLWQALTGFIAANYPIPSEWNFGGKNYGWNVWYRKDGKTLVTLYPQAKSFVVQIVLGKAQVEQALALKLHKHVSQVLAETPQLHDGRWLFIPVRSIQDIRDIQALLQVKRKPGPPRTTKPKE